jgi:small subunit ribosomal protein S25e
MGGKKKPTLSQLVKKAEREKAQQQAQKVKKEVKKEETQTKKTIPIIDEKLFQTIAKDVMTMKVVTPYEIASKYGIKMSTALKILRALRDRGDLTLVAKGHRTEIYVPVRKS